MPRTAPTPEPPEESRLLIPSGSTLINCCCSDSARGAWVPGTVVNVVGDKSAGKTMLAMSCMAEVAHDERFAHYRLDYRDIEARLNFDIPYLFGDRLASRLNMGGKIETVEDWLRDLWKILDDCELRKGPPTIYALDCFDFLTSPEEISKTKKKSEGEKTKGSYAGARKAGDLTALLRLTIRRLEATKSLLLVISQVRENMDAGIFDPKLYRGGGYALGHACTHELWLFSRGKLKKTVRERERIIGAKTCPRITKNSLTGKARETEVNIYYDYGIDDIGSCVDFMVTEGFWKKKVDPKTKKITNTISVPILGIEGSRITIIQQVEEKGLEVRLRKAVGKAWREIEESMRLNRKKRFE